jgi:hypothetical protein
MLITSWPLSIMLLFVSARSVVGYTFFKTTLKALSCLGSYAWNSVFLSISASIIVVYAGPSYDWTLTRSLLDVFMIYIFFGCLS